MRVKVPEIFGLEPRASISRDKKDSEVPASLGVGKTRNLKYGRVSDLKKTWSLKERRVSMFEIFGVLKYEESATPKDSKSESTKSLTL